MGWVVHRVPRGGYYRCASSGLVVGLGHALATYREPLGDGTSSHKYLWPAEAWEAYDAAITALEADGFVRHGVESVSYGVSAMQRLVRDSSEVTVKLDRTDVSTAALLRSVVRCEGGGDGDSATGARGVLPLVAPHTRRVSRPRADHFPNDRHERGCFPRSPSDNRASLGRLARSNGRISGVTRGGSPARGNALGGEGAQRPAALRFVSRRVVSGGWRFTFCLQKRMIAVHGQL